MQTVAPLDVPPPRQPSPPPSPLGAAATPRIFAAAATAVGADWNAGGLGGLALVLLGVLGVLVVAGVWAAARRLAPEISEEVARQRRRRLARRGVRIAEPPTTGGAAWPETAVGAEPADAASAAATAQASTDGQAALLGATETPVAPGPARRRNGLRRAADPAVAAHRAHFQLYNALRAYLAAFDAEETAEAAGHPPSTRAGTTVERVLDAHGAPLGAAIRGSAAALAALASLQRAARTPEPAVAH